MLETFNGILVGLSAGAALICERYLDLSKEKKTIKKGFGIIKNTILVPHYNDKHGELTGNYLTLRNLEIAYFKNNLLYKKILSNGRNGI